MTRHSYLHIKHQNELKVEVRPPAFMEQAQSKWNNVNSPRSKADNYETARECVFACYLWERCHLRRASPPPLFPPGGGCLSLRQICQPGAKHETLGTSKYSWIYSYICKKM